MTASIIVRPLASGKSTCGQQRLAVQFGEILLQCRNFRLVVIRDVEAVGMPLVIILMVILCGVEGLQWDDLSDDLAVNLSARRKLRDVSVGDLLLLVAVVK